MAKKRNCPFTAFVKKTSPVADEIHISEMHISTSTTGIIRKSIRFKLSVSNIPYNLYNMTMKIKRFHFKTVSSTNTWAKENIDQLDPKAINIISADEQSGGRGQFDRKWLSENGKGIYITIATQVAKGIDLTQIPMEYAKRIVALLEKVHVRATIKAPNDVLVDGKKIAGILTEVREPWCFVGIGLNLYYSESELSCLDQPATSLNLHIDDLSVFIKTFYNEIILPFI